MHPEINRRILQSGGIILNRYLCMIECVEIKCVTLNSEQKSVQQLRIQKAKEKKEVRSVT